MPTEAWRQPLQTTPAPALGFDDVGLVYGSGRRAVPALTNVTMSVGRGEFVSVLGPSGCGKSTLLRLAAGLLQPTSGRVFAAGSEVQQPTGAVGMVFQQATLLPWRSVLANVLTPLRAAGRPVDAAAQARARELLALVRLEGFDDRLPRELSGGMQQRVALARSLLHDPPLLLMDEPFSALDALTRETMMEELQRIWLGAALGAAPKSVLFVTHSIAEAVFLSDRIVVMSPRPGCIAEIVNVPFSRPRRLDDLAAPELVALAASLRERLRAMP
jgi:NitT/TauT family transport system ATP-binding protein